jgi:signal transduction histidine kinase
MTLMSVRARTGAPISRLIESILRVPLVAKLIGANVLIVAVAIAVHVYVLGGARQAELVAMLGALAAASVVNIFLVRLALQPIAELEEVSSRVSKGEFTARSVPSKFADAELGHLGKTVNSLLDSLAVERRRIQALGAEVVYAQDAERAKVARELHDSIAQTLAAVRLQLSATGNNADGDLKNQIVAASALVGAALEEVKNVSYSLHPRVAEDLGLETALGALARQVKERSGIHVYFRFTVDGPSVPKNVSATLFRVAQEALRNIEMHSRAKYATVEVVAKEGLIRIEVADDGCGFDPAQVPTGGAKTGLGTVKDRINLAGGSMKIDSIPNGGTRVVAEITTRQDQA